MARPADREAVRVAQIDVFDAVHLDRQCRHDDRKEPRQALLDIAPSEAYFLTARKLNLPCAAVIHRQRIQRQIRLGKGPA